MRPLARFVAGFALLALTAGVAQAQQTLLRVEKAPGGVRLHWTGGTAPHDAYMSATPRRVVSPARGIGSSATGELFRATPDPDQPLLFFQLGCAGAGCAERCFGGVDDDGDTLVDCADPDCSGSPDCDVESSCTNGMDDDGDDLLDCADPDCDACDDGDACTVDACDAGAPTGCSHLPLTCNDGDPCTTDTCDPGLGCVFTPVVCDDGDACNGLETCDPATGNCLPGVPVVCDDGDACNGVETCDPATGACLPGTPVTCDDGDACNGIESCDPATGNCLPGVPVACDDGDACNGLESCDPGTGDCLPGVPVTCGDGDACNGIETCDPATGNCLPGVPVVCDDGNACNGLETCDPATGDCLPGVPVTCDDRDACTLDACDPATGLCSFPPRSCDDGSACTVDTCDSATGCVFTPVTCDDRDACTDDACDPVRGCVTTPRNCDDGLDCTTDSCDPATGCRHDVNPASPVAQGAQLAGRSLTVYPWFAHVTAFNADAAVELGVDASRLPSLAGQTCDVYVVQARTDADWCAMPALVDARGAFDTRTFVAGGIQANRFPLVAPGQLSADAGTGIGVGYDVVLDCDRDGRLGSTDWIDGLGAEAGLYRVHDLTQAGPLATNSFDSIGPLPPWPGPWLSGDGEGDDVRIAYPALLDDPTFVGTFPLIMISHGNGHSFAWYVFLQQYLASHGAIVASHDNDTFFGIQEASSSTLYWTDRVIAQQGTLGGGVLAGHIDDSRIAWIGHSRGGEGVTRAYDRLHDEGFTPAQFAIGDVRLVISLAPTDFQGATESHPHGVPFHLVYGAADGDVSGCPEGPTDVTTSFNIYERGEGEKSSTYIHGAGHEELHDCGVSADEGQGPSRPGCENVHLVEKAAILGQVKRHLEAGGNVPALDFAWRQYEDLKPIGAPASMVVVREFDPGAVGALVIDDYQAAPATGTSSSGGTVTFSVLDVNEGLLNDADSTFAWTGADPFNGMTRVNAASDTQRGVTFRWNAAASYELAVPAAARDVRGFGWLSLRACQITRAPDTTAALGDLSFTVALVDGAARTSRITIAAYAGGIEEPYQRTACGAGTGWQDEFEVIRIRLDDFRSEASGLDLSDIRAVRLEFGGTAGSASGHIGLDEVEFQP